MGIFQRVVAAVLVMLIVIGCCGVLLCELHDCCHGIHQTKHICCSPHNHAAEECESHAEHNANCAMHTQSFEHKCHEIKSLSIESVVSERGSKITLLSTLYICLYNLMLPLEDLSPDLIQHREVAKECYSPSDGLLRAPPAFV